MPHKQSKLSQQFQLRESTPFQSAQIQDDQRQDFKVIKKDRISKLQQILKKNDYFRLQQNQMLKILDSSHSMIQRPIQKRSLPQIKRKVPYQEQIHAVVIQMTKKSDSLKIVKPKGIIKHHEYFAFNNQIISKAFQDEVKQKVQSQNPQIQNNRVDRSFLKLKVKILSLQIQKDKNHFVKQKSVLTSLDQSISRIKIIQKLSTVKGQSKQNQERKKQRNKKRNISQLNLTKIQHLPQIVFPKNKKCSKPRFPSSSMSKIDNNLITNQILELEQSCNIEKRQRQKRQKLFMVKVKKQNQRSSLVNIMYQ